MPQILFVHNNFPGQFVHVAASLALRDGYRIFAIGGRTARSIPGVLLERYAVEPIAPLHLPRAASPFAGDVARGEAVAKAAQRLAAGGARPDLIVGHAGWGEMLFVQDVFPAARVISYLEFFFSVRGADVNFDPAFPLDGLSEQMRLRVRNAPALFAAAQSDVLVAPTHWQASRLPAALGARVEVIHEGIDTARAAPVEDVVVELSNGMTLTRADEVVTFVARNLEPYRGYHVFMRALPAILRDRPQARVLIAGGSETSYGSRPPSGRTWQDIYWEEVRGRLDPARVHFLGQVPYDVFLGVLQLSRVHVYLTYPFVLSWSLLEAMSCGALVVASRTAPVQEVIEHGVNGLLVDFFDTEALAETVGAALRDADAGRALRKAARRTIIDRYDLASVCLPQWQHLVEAQLGPPDGSDWAEKQRRAARAAWHTQALSQSS